MAGFLYNEGLIRHRDELKTMSYGHKQDLNVINVELGDVNFTNLMGLERHFFTNSSCAVCGKTSLESLKIKGCQPIPLGDVVKSDVLFSLVNHLNSAQKIFASTGGLHAAALFDLNGNLLKLRADVGRDNALDKVIDAAFLADG